MFHWERALKAVQAAQRSKDDSTKVGAALFNAVGQLLVQACNSFPCGVHMNPYRQQRPNKYQWTVHAELNVVAFCGVRGDCTLYSEMYSTQIPCSICMGVLVQAGVAKVFCPDPSNLADKWRADAEVAKTIASEGGIVLEFQEFPSLT